jgi:hypothetical protein
LRRFFEVDRWSIAFAAMRSLVKEHSLKASSLAAFRKRYNYAPAALAPWRS